MIYPIVGAHFHRPAKAIISVLPIGARLEIIPEPDNEYDPNAIAIWVSGTEIPPNAVTDLEPLALGYGFHASEIMTDEMWMLGYIPRELAAKLTLHEALVGKFSVGANGGPRVEFEL